MKIVSGGQTGVDRGALDAALELGIECGGWCPKGRRAEDGVIPGRYPLTELGSTDYPVRTKKNAEDSDATLVIHFGELEGGTRYTVQCCKTADKPCFVVDLAAMNASEAAKRIGRFVEENKVETLNVAGPRASKRRNAAETTRALLILVLRDERVVNVPAAD